MSGSFGCDPRRTRRYDYG